ncbi:MAG: formylmethanofuran dehydrogenase subunit A [Anaerolineales bacterium]|nr:formylmethanofuran dehydrogenase subunit A [Anaerolineales bacterium]
MAEETGLRIAGARVYDPANGVDGAAQEVCIRNGRIVAALPPEAATLDARGLVLMPGGVDLHSHIAGHTINLARRMMPQEHRRDPQPGRGDGRSGTGGSAPSTFATGQRYAALGYTTVMDAAIAPLRARQAVAELEDTPIVDKGFFALLGNNRLLFDLLAAGRTEEVREAVAWWLAATRAYAVKLANPGGVEQWKRSRQNVTELDEAIGGLALTPRQVIDELAQAANALGLPHPIHLHGLNLGQPGNAAVTLQTLQTLAGQRAHVCHIQFHCYGATDDGRPTSRAREIVEYLGAHPELSADVGQVLFGPAMTTTADIPVSAWLHHLTRGPWVSGDVECETGCGLQPLTYREASYAHALQWALGLELFLLSPDPWRLVFSTDHPNGALFTSYPRLIRLLMDKTFRAEQMARANPAAVRQTALADGLTREYTLGEIAIITRAGPAKLLGLTNKGHLGPGADADLALYEDQPDKEAMFSAPRYVFKAGQRVVGEGELRAEPQGQLLSVTPGYDPAIERTLRPWFADNYSVSFDNYAVPGSPARRRPDEAP